MDEQKGLSHIGPTGDVRMVDVSEKAKSLRTATAVAHVVMQESAHVAMRSASNKKGDVLAVVRIAGIQAAKETSRLIPLCHPVPLSFCEVSIEDVDARSGMCAVEITATAKAADATGVEMEALTAATVAALTLYDMLKAIDPAMTIERVFLLHKDGGRRGEYARQQ